MGHLKERRFLGSCLQISCPLWLHSAMKQHQLFLRMKSADKLSLCLWILQISNWLLLCLTSLLSPLMRQ
ncbi:unnamed protein product, partial [Sphagnum jensenii]